MTTSNRIRGFRKWALIVAVWFILQASPLRAQMTGTAPLAITGAGIQFNFQSDGTVISEGSSGSSSLASGDQGAGVRELWWPYQAAFRAGSVDGSQWDSSNIGQYSVAFGVNTTASGYASTASGYLCYATGDAACFATGWQTTAGYWCDTSFGNETMADGGSSTSFGQGTVASGPVSTASGFYTSASGNYSTSSGYFTNAASIGSFVVGALNVGGGSPSSWVGTDPLFEVGNGYSADGWWNATRSDAFVVYKNGNATLSGTLSIPGNNVVLVNGEGDLSMGSFHAGPTPAPAPTQQ